MKQFFRFFRGELNGYFLNALCVFPNLYLAAQEFIDELVYHCTVQWVLDGFQSDGHSAIREADLYGIGKIGGLFQLRSFTNSSLGSIWFTPSRVVQGAERSERGLVDVEYESFMFVRVMQDNYPTDISHEASEERRMTYRPKDAVLIGYVPEGIDLFDADGRVLEHNILPAPPVNKAYIEFYGLKYLYYEEQFDAELPLSPDVYKLLFEAVQRIRRKGPSILALLELTDVLGGGYIINLDVQQVNSWFECTYDLDENVLVHNRERRYAAWLDVCEMKFKEFVFIANKKTPGGP